MSLEMRAAPTWSAGLDALRAGLCGQAFVPGDEWYADAARAWNLNAEQRPAVVVVAEDAADVQLAVCFARNTGLGLGVMATGHGVGTPCHGGVLLNTSRMRGVRVDPVAQRARVEAGARWADLIPLAQANGLAGLAGSAPHVGIVGYTLGGGFGWLGRRHGLNAASVTGAEMVTPDGQLRHLSATQHADLFWGLRGGGGNFGVVTALEFRLYPLTQVYGGALYYPVEQAAEVLARYAHWAADLPDDWTTAVALMNLPPRPGLPEAIRGRSVIVVKGCCCGEDLEDAAARLQPLRADLGEPLLGSFRRLPVAELDTISMDPVEPLGVLQHTELLSDLTPEAIADLLRVAGAGSGSRLGMVELRPLGGALVPDAACPSPLGRGEARYSLNAIGMTPSPDLGQPVAEQLDRLAGALRPHRTDGTVLNFLEVEPTPQRVRAAYSTGDWARLVALKDAHDPTNLLRFNRNIPPTGWAERKDV